MQASHDESLIKLYVSQVQQLATQADSGQNVDVEMQAVVNEACDYFSIVSSSNAVTSRKAFKHRLKLYAALTYKSRPKFRSALEFAASLVY